MQVLLLPIGRGFTVGHRGLGLGRGDRWACPGCGGDLRTPGGGFRGVAGG